MVNKRDSYVVVAQLCPEFTARLVDRWQELEAQASTGFKVPTTLSAALRLAADQADTIEAQQAKLAQVVGAGKQGGLYGSGVAALPG
jgi:phage regulator Rha-like protein